MKTINKSYLKTAAIDAFFAILCFVFGMVYEYFGFGVRSPFMHLAYLIPLLMGTLVYLIAAVFGNGRLSESFGHTLWQAAVATLTIGSLVQGALEIYGTSSPLVFVYLAAALLCAFSAIGTLMYAAVIPS